MHVQLTPGDVQAIHLRKRGRGIAFSKRGAIVGPVAVGDHVVIRLSIAFARLRALVPRLTAIVATSSSR